MQSVRTFYALKAQYEEKNKQLKSRLHTKKLSAKDLVEQYNKSKACIRCGGQGGSHFSVEYNEADYSRHLIAACGRNDGGGKCSFQMDVRLGVTTLVTTAAAATAQEINDVKFNIILEKNNLATDLKSSDEVLRNVTAYAADLTELEQEHTTYLQQYNSAIINAPSIPEVTRLAGEMRGAMDITSAVDYPELFATKLYANQSKSRRLQYKNSGVVPVDKTAKVLVNALFQEKYSIADLEIHESVPETLVEVIPAKPSKRSKKPETKKRRAKVTAAATGAAEQPKTRKARRPRKPAVEFELELEEEENENENDGIVIGEPVQLTDVEDVTEDVTEDAIENDAATSFSDTFAIRPPLSQESNTSPPSQSTQALPELTIGPTTYIVTDDDNADLSPSAKQGAAQILQPELAVGPDKETMGRPGSMDPENSSSDLKTVSIASDMLITAPKK